MIIDSIEGMLSECLGCRIGLAHSIAPYIYWRPSQHFFYCQCINTDWTYFVKSASLPIHYIGDGCVDKEYRECDGGMCASVSVCVRVSLSVHFLTFDIFASEDFFSLLHCSCCWLFVFMCAEMVGILHRHFAIRIDIGNERGKEIERVKPEWRIEQSKPANLWQTNRTAGFVALLVGRLVLDREHWQFWFLFPSILSPIYLLWSLCLHRIANCRLHIIENNYWFILISWPINASQVNQPFSSNITKPAIGAKNKLKWTIGCCSVQPRIISSKLIIDCVKSFDLKQLNLKKFKINSFSKDTFSNLANRSTGSPVFYIAMNSVIYLVQI